MATIVKHVLFAGASASVQDEAGPSRRERHTRRSSETSQSFSRKSVDSSEHSQHSSGGGAPGTDSSLYNQYTFDLIDPASEYSTALVPSIAKCLLRLCEASADIAAQVRVPHGHARPHLAETVNDSFQDGGATPKSTPFHGARTPPINLEDYLQRIAHYTKCSPACFVMAIAYMDTLYQAGLALGRDCTIYPLKMPHMHGAAWRCSRVFATCRETPGWGPAR